MDEAFRVFRYPKTAQNCFSANQSNATTVVVGLVVGNFDGVHIGHQAIIAKLDELLSSRVASATKPIAIQKGLVTFHPHPRVVLAKERASASISPQELTTITSVTDRLRVVASFGIDFAFVPRFTRSFSKLSPEQFVQDYLIVPFRPQVVVVGEDWSFGRNRAGTPETLHTLGKRHGFEVAVVPAVTIRGRRVSTSEIKAALASGDMTRVCEMLGRFYSLRGRVEHGEKRGRALGYPTANIRVRSRLIPSNGVYATIARIGGKRYAAATNIGVRPTFSGTVRLVEAHVLDAPELNLYDQSIEVEFVERLRPEQAFASPDALRQAIALDVEQVRRIIAGILSSNRQ